jgi:3',5'-cyclic AMP phosphodiesterase CpdA
MYMAPVPGVLVRETCMTATLDRRDFLGLAGLGGVVFASALSGCATAGAGGGATDFHFVQLSDLHWGFRGPAVNPEAANALPRAIAAVNAMPSKPDFVVFTGDLSHTTDDPVERRRRLKEVRSIIDGLDVKTRYFLPGEHDASLDRGEAFMEVFGATHHAFDHGGIHFIAIDNVSDPAARIGEAQLAWLKADLDRLPADAPIVVFTHRPLFDLAPEWDWATRDGAAAIELLSAHRHVTVFYGHIHQEHHRMTGAIAHHAATSLIFPLPAPQSQPRREPIKWDPAQPFRGLGWREVVAGGGNDAPAFTQHPLAGA